MTLRLHTHGAVLCHQCEAETAAVIGFRKNESRGGDGPPGDGQTASRSTPNPGDARGPSLFRAERAACVAIIRQSADLWDARGNAETDRRRREMWWYLAAGARAAAEEIEDE